MLYSRLSEVVPGGGGGGGGGGTEEFMSCISPLLSDVPDVYCSIPCTSAATASSSCFKAVSACLLKVPPKIYNIK